MTETSYDLEDSIEIAADRARVWALVSDVRRMHEWSPQVLSTRIKSDEVGLGTDFTNLNQHGELQWPTHATVTRFEPERAIAFKVKENWVSWSFELTPTDGGTLLTQRREAPDGISPMSLEWTEEHLGGQADFTDTQRSGIAASAASISARWSRT